MKIGKLLKRARDLDIIPLHFDIVKRDGRWEVRFDDAPQYPIFASIASEEDYEDFGLTDQVINQAVHLHSLLLTGPSAEYESGWMATSKNCEGYGRAPGLVGLIDACVQVLREEQKYRQTCDE